MSKVKAKGIALLCTIAFAVILAAALCMGLPATKVRAQDNPFASLPSVEVTDEGVATVNDWTEMVVAINYDGTETPLNPNGEMVEKIVLGGNVTFDFLDDPKLQILMKSFVEQSEGGYADSLYISRNIDIDLGGNTLTVETGSEAFAVVLYGDSAVTISNGSIKGVSKGDFVDVGSANKGVANLTLKDVAVTFDYQGDDDVRDAVILNAGTLRIENVTFDVTGGVRSVANATVPAGSVSYATLQDEINALPGIGYVSTVELSKDYEESITIPEGKAFTLDLAGHTLTNEAGEHTIINKGTLTVIDSGGGGTGTVDNVSHARAALVNYGTVQIGNETTSGGTFTRSQENGVYDALDTLPQEAPGGNSCYTIKNYGHLSIYNEKTRITMRKADRELSDGRTEPTGGYSSLIQSGYADGENYESIVEQVTVADKTPKVTVYGGCFVGGINTVKNDEHSVLDIQGGKFENYVQNVILNYDAAEISGGEFMLTGAVTQANAAIVYASGETEISGGTFAVAEFAHDYCITHGVRAVKGTTIVGGVSIEGVDFAVTAEAEAAVEVAEGAAGVLKAAAQIERGGKTLVYGDFSTAVAEAQDGETVKLADDLVLTEVLLIENKSIVLDLASYTMTLSGDFGGNDVAIRVGDNGSLTIEGSGKIDASDNGSVPDNIVPVGAMGSGSKVIINGGTIVVDTAYESCVFANTDGYVEINGGSLQNLCEDEYKNGGGGPALTVNVRAGVADASKLLVVNGGTFIGRNPALGDDSVPGTFLGADVKIARTENGFAAFTEETPAGATAIYYDEPEGSVAEVYKLDAFREAIGYGYAVIRLGADIEGYGIIKRSLTFDLNGHTLTSKSDSNNAIITLWVIGSDQAGGERIEVDITSSVGDRAGAIKHETSSSASYAFKAYGAVDLTISNILIENTASGAYGAAFGNGGISAQVIAEVTDSTIRGEYPAVYVAGTGIADKPTVFIARNCRLEAVTMGIMGNGSETYQQTRIELYDTEVIAESNNADTEDWDNMGLGIYHPQQGTLLISGGSITGVASAIEMRAGSLKVSGGAVLTATSKKFHIESNGSGSTTCGAAVAVSQHSTNYPISVNVENATLNGFYALYEEDVQDTSSDSINMSVTGGTFNGKVDSENVTSFIGGGTFAELVPGGFLTEDAVLTVTEDGAFGVEEDAAVAATLVRGETEYSFTAFADAFAVAEAGDTVVLKDKVTLNDTLTVDKAIVLDLGGFVLEAGNNAIAITAAATVMNGTIKAAAGEAGYVDNGTTAIAVQGVAVRLEGLKITGEATDPAANLFLITVENGSLEVADSNITMTFASDSEKQGQVIRTVNSDLAISDSEITANGGYGVAFRGGMTQEKAVAADASEYNKLTIADSAIKAELFAIAGNGTTHGTVITVSGDSKIESTNGVAIYHPQYGILNIALNEDGAQAYIRGLSGIEMRAGALNVESGLVEATGSALVSEPNGNGSTTEGAAVAIVQHTTKLPINVALSGGTYKGQYALYEENQQQNEPEAIKKISISVTGGVYEGNIGSQDVTGFISGGKFAQLPNEDCMSPDYVAQMGGDGYYVPVESTVLRGAQKNAQADIREYAAMLGMRWLDILTAAESDTDAALVVSLHDSIVDATSENRIAEARLAAMDAIDELSAAIDAYKAKLIAQLQEFALNDPATDEDDLVVVVPTATYLSINSAATKAEADFYYNNAIAEVKDIRAYRAEIAAQTATLETLSAALSDLGEETLLSNIQKAIADAQDAITGGDSYTLAGISDSLTNTINTALQTIDDKFDTYADYMQEMYEAILGTGEGTSLFEQIQKAIADAQGAITSDNAEAIAKAVKTINGSIDAAAGEIKGAIPDYAEKLAAIGGTLENLQTAVGGNSAAIAEVLQEVKDAQKAILDAADEDIAGVMTAVNAANAAVAEAKKSILDAIGGTDGLVSKLTDITSTLEGFETKLGSITTSLDNELDAIDAAISVAQTDIKSILTKLGSLATGSDMTGITEDLAAILEDIAQVQTTVGEISTEVSTVTAVAEAKEQAFTDIEAWLNEYLDSIIGVTEEADSGKAVALAFTAETTDGDIYAKLTKAFSEDNAKLVLKYYNEALASIDGAKTVSDVTTAVSTFKAQVASVEAAAQNTSDLVGVYVLLAIVIVAVVAVLIVVLLKKRGAAPDGNPVQEEEKAEPEPVQSAPAPAEEKVADTAEPLKNELAAELDDDKEQVVIAANVRSFAEAYVDLSDEMKGLFKKVKEYALSKEGTAEIMQSSGVCIKRDGKQVVKLTVRRGYPVALFILENEMLKDFRRTSNSTAKLKVRATELVLREEADLTAANTMIDLSIEQIDKDIEAAKERRREARRARRKQKQEEQQKEADLNTTDDKQ